MLGHIDPASCNHQWGVRYRALMERYQHIVRFGLYGHIHTEFFVLSNSMTSPDKPVMVHSVVGSVVPVIEERNPGFMTLDLDAQTLLPIDKHSYYFELDKANDEGSPTWQNFSYRETYDLADLSPSSMKDLANRIKTDQDLAI